jgi:hypothetical protein
MFTPEDIDGAELPLCFSVNNSGFVKADRPSIFYRLQNSLRITIMIPINRRTFIMAAAAAVTPTLTLGLNLELLSLFM